MVPYVGPIEVRFENRNCYVGALVLGGDVLLGAIPMEDMDVVISPLHRKIVVNPDSPNFAHAMVKVLADGGALRVATDVGGLVPQVAKRH